MDNIRSIAFLLLIGSGGYVLSQGDLNAIDFQNLDINQIETYLNSLDLGPLNGLVADMKDAIKTIMQMAQDFINETQSSQ